METALWRPELLLTSLVTDSTFSLFHLLGGWGGGVRKSCSLISDLFTWQPVPHLKLLKSQQLPVTLLACKVTLITIDSREPWSSVPG